MTKFVTGMFGHEAWYRMLEIRWHRIRQVKRQAGYDPKIDEMVPIVIKGHYQGPVKGQKSVPKAIEKELPSHLSEQFGEVKMKRGLKNPQDASRVITQQIIGFNKSEFIRTYKSKYGQGKYLSSKKSKPILAVSRQSEIRVDDEDEQARLASVQAHHG